MAEPLDSGACAVVAGVEQVPNVAFAENPAPLAHFDVPMSGPLGREHRVLSGRLEARQLGRELVRLVGDGAQPSSK